MRLHHLLLALFFLVLSAGSEAASDTSGMSCGKMTLDRGFGPRAPVLALPWTAGHGPLRRLRALVGEMPELGELTPRSPRF
ncbi:hypothetical protein CapIbe_021765 [Capra ibex]